VRTGDYRTAARRRGLRWKPPGLWMAVFGNGFNPVAEREYGGERQAAGTNSLSGCVTLQ